MILLVLSMHAADTYSPLGNWYFVDRTPLTTPTLLFFAAWQSYLQSFFMGLLFFVAGFFTPSSLDRKGPLNFLHERLFRLGLPVLFYMFVLGPITEYYIAGSWTSTDPTSFAIEWIKHIRNGQFLQENGPLWFCLALLFFSVGYVALRGHKASVSAAGELARAPRTLELIGFALVIAISTFLIRLEGQMKLLNINLGDIPQQVLLFGAGISAARQGWLPKVSYSYAVRCLILTLVVGFPVWLAILVTGGALDGHADVYSGGRHWQSAAINVWESLTCVGLCVGLLAIFRDRFNVQGPLTKFLSDNAFSVYVFHPPILIVAARVLHGIAWPAVSKFVVLTCVAAVMSFTLSAVVFRRIPLLRDIL